MHRLLFSFCALTCAAFAQTASTRNDPSKSSAASATEDVVQLSPFQVTGAQDRGYQASTTLSGTRLNSNLEDLAASISVVTKQQLLDTASVDINDVFKYELNTEGTYQWTSFNVDRGVVTDDVQNNPQGATRIRGLTSANIASNGFATSLPFDTYDIDAVEISRGPNSTVFGLGNTGGGVNVIKAKANLTKDVTSFTTRTDSYGGYRGNFDLNRKLLSDRLAVRVLGVYDEKGYQRRPSQDTTRRLQVAVIARPLKNTTIYGSFESYRNFNTRPNSLTPRDTITDWIASGRPTWDPTTQTVNFRDGRPSIPNVTTANEAALLPFGLAVSDSAFQNSPSPYIEHNGTVGLFMINRTPAAGSAGPTNVAGTQRLLQNGNFYVRNSSLYPLYNPAQISDKSLYDWTSMNLSAPNFATTRGETSSVQIDQFVLRTPRQTLALQGSWLYERIATYDRRFLGAGATNLQPFIDINEKLLDGTPNPYFLRTYIGGAAPSFRRGWTQNENYRGTLAYELNASQEKNFLHWLGRHRLSGFGEYRSIHAANLGYQDTISSTNSWMGGTPSSRNNTTYRTYPRYYVGDASGQNIDYAPSRTSSPPYTYPLRYFNGVTNQWLTENVTYDEYYDGNRPNKRLLSTYGGVWQGFFWNDRIVPLLGVRRDSNRSRDANSAINPTVATNGYYDTTPIYSYGTNDWVQNRGKTDTEGLVVKPLRWLHLSYSQSNSFNPGSAVYDVWGVPLPDPRGKTKDYGFQLNLFNNRLIIVAKQYETIDIGRSTSDLNTIVQRAIRMDRRSSSGDPGLTDWYLGQLQILHPEWDQATLVAQTLQATGADYDYLRSHINKTHGDASNSISRGKEIEMVYNPTPFWTTRATLTQSNPLNGILSPAVQAYIDSRMSTWTTIKDPVTGANWWTTRGPNNTIPRDFYINNVLANLKLATALQGKRRSQTREYRAAAVTNYRFAGVTDSWLKNADIGGAVRWEDKASIGFLGAAPDSDGIVREYDPNKPVWDKARYYVDLSAGYRLRFFRDKVQCRLQVNVNNVFEKGRLQPIAVNPDGQPWAFRIIDPRMFVFSATFTL